MPSKPSRFMSSLQRSLGGGGIAADPNSTWNTQEGPFGQMGAGTGNDPSLSEAPTEAPFSARVSPFTNAGEFNEWKNAKMMGIPTAFGQRAQQRYDSRMIPGMTEMLDQAAPQGARDIARQFSKYPEMSPALQALLRGIK